ncbi:type II toxin-antitoxin system RelE family toxin [Chitinophaga japonensis]|uniref:mRNA interferase RelE/StbE n=1 Tax=Chitinophaga japonensis TaxID=104662 RepID=A0A562T5V2_CHIJA|nr:type II toxin-antitoxin system RelE/ParE family toxin [Chitinophaga japonensis]TWI88905.1 mRNA interferase RelE/StbE [Chitinophaga japonensis]
MYNVILEKGAQKKLYKLPAREREKITEKIKALAGDPRPPGCKKLMGREGYRIRVGNYRVIYNIHDNILTILVIDIGDRKSIYD